VESVHVELDPGSPEAGPRLVKLQIALTVSIEGKRVRAMDQGGHELLLPVCILTRSMHDCWTNVRVHRTVSSFKPAVHKNGSPAPIRLLTESPGPDSDW